MKKKIETSSFFINSIDNTTHNIYKYSFNQLYQSSIINNLFFQVDSIAFAPSWQDTIEDRPSFIPCRDHTKQVLKHWSILDQHHHILEKPRISRILIDHFEIVTGVSSVKKYLDYVC